MYLTLLNTLLFAEWNLNMRELIILSMAFNLGLFFGSLICSIYADSMGRKNILVFGATVQFFTVLLTAFA